MITTLSEDLRAIFRILGEHARKSTPQSPVTLLVCWRRTFFDADKEDACFFEAMAMVQGGITRLALQVSASRALDAEGKVLAHGLIGGLLSCTAAENFPQQAHALASNFANDRLGMLGLLANVLRNEFGERQVSDTELVEFIAAVKDLDRALKESTIDSNLKTILQYQLSVLLWTLEHARFVGPLGIQDATARITFASSTLPKDDAGSDGNKDSLRTRFMKVCGRILHALKIVGDVDRGMNALEHIGDEVGQIATDLASQL